MSIPGQSPNALEAWPIPSMTSPPAPAWVEASACLLSGGNATSVACATKMAEVLPIVLVRQQGVTDEQGGLRLQRGAQRVVTLV